MKKVCWGNNKKLGMLMASVAAFSIALGILIEVQSSPEMHELQRFSGMLIGFGFGILGVIAAKMIQHRFSTPEKLKEREIERNDERNIQLLRASYTVAAVVSLVMFAVMSFVFVLMGQVTASWIAMAALYIEALTIFISYKILEKRM